MTLREAMIKVIYSTIIAAIVYPIGIFVFPMISSVGHVAFAAMEAAFSATLGFAVYGILVV